MGGGWVRSDPRPGDPPSVLESTWTGFRQMAKPRVFISSTFYDLRYVRADLERFVRELGYEPVLSERGQVAYGRSESLQQYCHREISTCDMLVNIVGGRFGSESPDTLYSVSQMELKTAHDLNKQIYVFVERAVHVEYRTWLRNQDNPKFCPQCVDNLRVYAFLQEVYSLASNNVITDFDSVHDMLAFLLEQWAGLFQRFLQDESRREDYKISSNLKSTAETLAQIMKYATQERDQTIRSILVHGHPVFKQLATTARIPIRVQFFNRDEMETVLRTFRFEAVATEDIDSRGDFIFQRTVGDKRLTLIVAGKIFDESGNLLPMDPERWNESFVEGRQEEVSSAEDNLPF